MTKLAVASQNCEGDTHPNRAPPCLQKCWPVLYLIPRSRQTQRVQIRARLLPLWLDYAPGNYDGTSRPTAARWVSAFPEHTVAVLRGHYSISTSISFLTFAALWLPCESSALGQVSICVLLVEDIVCTVNRVHLFCGWYIGELENQGKAERGGKKYYTFWDARIAPSCGKWWHGSWWEDFRKCQLRIPLKG